MPPVDWVNACSSDLQVLVLHFVDVPTIGAFGAACKRAQRVAFREADEASARTLWRSKLELLGSRAGSAAGPLAKRYAALRACAMLRFQPVHVNCADRRILHRTGAAAAAVAGRAYLFGGTYRGNIGPVLDDLFEVRAPPGPHPTPVSVVAVERGPGPWPQPRRGHTFTSLGARGVVIGGWGDETLSMDPWFVDFDKAGVPTWSSPPTTGSVRRPFGAKPVARAFHSATLISDRHLVVYGGLANRCLADTWLLDVETLAWNFIGSFVERAGHGAAFFRDSARMGRLFLVGGAVRSADGDEMRGDVDVVNVWQPEDEPGCHEPSPWPVFLEFQQPTADAPAVRTGCCLPVARHVLLFGGSSNSEDPDPRVVALDVDRGVSGDSDVRPITESLPSSTPALAPAYDLPCAAVRSSAAAVRLPGRDAYVVLTGECNTAYLPRADDYDSDDSDELVMRGVDHPGLDSPTKALFVEVMGEEDVAALADAPPPPPPALPSAADMRRRLMLG